MKVFLSIWLSIILMITGLPITGQEQDSRRLGEEVFKEQEIKQQETADTADSEKDSAEDNVEVLGRQKEEEPGLGASEEKDMPVGKKERESAQESDKKEHGEKPETELGTGDNQKGSGKKKKAEAVKKDGKKESIEKKQTELSEKDAEKKELGEATDDLEVVSEEKQAGVPSVEVKLDGEEKNLIFEEGEGVEFLVELGYHIVPSRKVKCIHTPSTINASIKCRSAAEPLNPTKDELLNNIELTGKLKKKNFTAKTVADDKGGKDNTVTHLRLEAKVDAPGMSKELLAGPYLCGDGYAAYAYFEMHYSYCPNSGKFCKAGESHVWLGCKGGDKGTVEFHPTEFQHTFTLYKKAPNKYTIKYNANGGTGKIDQQNALYGDKVSLSKGDSYKRQGYTLTGWNTSKDGKGIDYKLGQKTQNLTSDDGGEVTLYAQWRVNSLTVKYNANGGFSDTASAANRIDKFTNKWNYKTGKKDLANFSSFQLTRNGYIRKDGAEWNTKPDGTGKAFDQDVGYEMLEYAPDLKNGDQEIVLYAQWKPCVYTITLNNGLKNPSMAGTARLYKKYETGLFFDSAGSKGFTSGQTIVLPKKSGYLFRGYYFTETDLKDVFADGTEKKMIDSTGRLTADGAKRRKIAGNETWIAKYDYLVGCEDYADIPCDLTRIDGDNREDLGVLLSYDSNARKVSIHTKQTGCDVSLTVQPPGTEIGNFRSSLGAGSASGSTGGTQDVCLPLTVPEGAAYRLMVRKEDKSLCDRFIYLKNGRFRALAKLGKKDAEKAGAGGSLAGSAWGTYDAGYELYEYYGCSEIKNIQAPGNVQRYFRYKDVNMAYSGNGATFGRNTLEYDVSLEDMYQFRENGFAKEKIEKKYTKDRKEYECRVRYSFQGWEMSDEYFYAEKDQHKVADIYLNADEKKVVSTKPTEDISTYQEAVPILILPQIEVMGLSEDNRAVQAGIKEYSADAAVKKANAKEYVNLRARWDSCPTIVVAPGERMEFYEGEEVSKEKLISRLLAHDNEDNRDIKKNPDLNDKLRIVKVSYPESKNHSQATYEKTFEKDVPEDFLLDTYYLKLEKNEAVNVLVTFAVTDSIGNTTEEQIPVKVKYNHYPEISSEDIFYYLKEEANRGKITSEELLGRASAEDEEDGNVTGKLGLKDFNPQLIKMQTEAKAEFNVTYQVTDAYKKTSYRTVKIVVWDEDAAIAEMPKQYVRYISEKYLNTLEKNSAWREPQNFAYLKSILRNETPIQMWVYTHEDVLAVQEWITQDGEGCWKLGQDANRVFLKKFAHCRQ